MYLYNWNPNRWARLTPNELNRITINKQRLYIEKRIDWLIWLVRDNERSCSNHATALLNHMRLNMNFIFAHETKFEIFGKRQTRCAILDN